MSLAIASRRLSRETLERCVRQLRESADQLEKLLEN